MTIHTSGRCINKAKTAKAPTPNAVAVTTITILVALILIYLFAVVPAFSAVSPSRPLPSYASAVSRACALAWPRGVLWFLPRDIDHSCLYRSLSKRTRSDEGPHPPSDRDPLSIACELVGQFQYHFARIEQALNVGIATLFGLNDIASDIICANLDFMRKVYIVRSQVIMQFKDRDEYMISLLGRISRINEPHRQTVIHSRFEPHEGGVKFTRLIAKQGLEHSPHIWPKKKFDDLCATMDGLARELEQIVKDLEPYKPSLDFSDPRNSQYFVF
jgi:hypothetical protein